MQGDTGLSYILNLDGSTYFKSLVSGLHIVPLSKKQVGSNQGYFRLTYTNTKAIIIKTFINKGIVITKVIQTVLNLTGSSGHG